MTARDELVAVIREAIDGADPQYGFPSDDAADAILARWRLVPVEEATTLDQERDKWASAYFGVDIAAQRRAADELTQHDQAAGHYDRCTSVHDMLWRCELQAGHNGPHEG